MSNTRVKELLEKIATETDSDKLEILQFDLAEAMGQKDKGVKRRKKGGSEMTDKQKKFAALAPPTDRITYADKIVGATGEVRKAKGGGYGGGGGGDEVLAARRCKGGGIALKGTDFKGTF